MTDNRPKTVPFCVNCEHCCAAAGLDYVCRHNNQLRDIVSGEAYWPECKDMRADPDKCGWSALWYRPKP